MATVSEAIQMAVQRHAAGRLDEAEAIYRQVLAAEPQNVSAWHLIGRLAQEFGDLEAAVNFIGRAIRLKPDYPEAYLDLGAVLYQQGKLDEAAACQREGLKLNPLAWEAENNLGTVLKAQGKLAEAAACYRRALAIEPACAEVHNNLGGVLLDQGFPDEAIACSERALECDPRYAEAHINIGNALKDQGHVPLAVERFRKAIETKPNFIKATDNLLYSLYFTPGYDAQAIYDEHRRWNDSFAALLASSEPHANDRSPDRRLKIGFVSPDFRTHAQAYFTLPLFTAFDRAQFELVCYSDVFRPDDVTVRLKAAADAWRDIAGHSDASLAHMVRDDKIDILVDLTMHMAHSRLFVFARQPAPVQVT
jgi:predicted O-linked N-acetylglucosamine transferase (SPINDLY family)